jgi:hypothetical protein
VDAPDGTAARPFTPLSSVTSASTVGLPRESITCLPLISLIALMVASLQLSSHQVKSYKVLRPRSLSMIDVSPMANRMNNDQAFVMNNFIDDSIVTHSQLE